VLLRGEGSAGQIYQFVSDFIMPENHETSLLASERMLQGEMGISTVAFVGEVVWCFCSSTQKNNTLPSPKNPTKT
jgi:hypothetical protein